MSERPSSGDSFQTSQANFRLGSDTAQRRAKVSVRFAG
jgi:hypothetical protein